MQSGMALLTQRMTMIDHYYAVIMAGGGGTRLWPVSRQTKPKQMLRLTGERTMFQMAVDRLENLFSPEHILVVTIAKQAEELQQQCPHIPAENFIIEPMPRGTASVVGLAAIILKHRDPMASMVVLTADHYIEHIDFFGELLLTALEVAQVGYLVTLGIQPSYPATGYGYIQRGESIGKYRDQTVYCVQRFKEKPNIEQAQNFIVQGDHYWNSGMFIWRVDRILEEFKKWMPQLLGVLKQIETALKENTYHTVLPSVWHAIRPETIDYGIMERAQEVAVLPAGDLGWNDVGSWDSLFEVITPDKDGNIFVDAQHMDIDTKSSLIFTDHTDRLIVTIGVKDLIVIDTHDALLICSRENVQKVRDMVNLLKQTGHQHYL